MRITRSVLVALLSLTLTGTGSQADVSGSDCAANCVENSKFVSQCNGDQSCLCSDSDYREAILSCLWSQCSTARLGHAMHQALSLCVDQEEPAKPIIYKQIITQSHLRRREVSSGYASGYASGSASASGYSGYSGYSAGSIRPSGYYSGYRSASASVRPSLSLRGSMSGSFTRIFVPATSTAAAPEPTSTAVMPQETAESETDSSDAY